MKPKMKMSEDNRREMVRDMVIKQRIAGKVDSRYKGIKGLGSKSMKPKEKGR